MLKVGELQAALDRVNHTYARCLLHSGIPVFNADDTARYP